MHDFVKVRLVVLAVFVSLTSPARAAEECPRIPDVPEGIAAAHPELVKERTELLEEHSALDLESANWKGKCKGLEPGSKQENDCLEARDHLRVAIEKYCKRTSALVHSLQTAIDQAKVYLAPDPVAARLSAAELRLVDHRIANLQKAIALLGDSNPEWAREREQVLEDMREDKVGACLEGVNIVTLGLAEGAKFVAGKNLSAAHTTALVKAFREPLANLPGEEARLNRIMATTQDPALTKAILEYTSALHRLREAERTKDLVTMTARTRDAAEALWKEFELMKMHPPPSRDVADALYVSSAVVGGLAIVFVTAEGPKAIAAAGGSFASSLFVGGRELVNIWQESNQLAALQQDAGRRNHMKHELLGRLNDLQRERVGLVDVVQRSGGH